jgi:branched-chain amino acid aminotransferase
MRTAYLNGAWINERDLVIPVGDLGFALGVTVTERLRTFNGVVWRQAEHIARLANSLEIIGLDRAIAAELDRVIGEYVLHHQSQRASGDDWAIVAFATPGDGHGRPLRCVHGFPLPFGGWAHQFQAGVKLVTSSIRQTPPNCWPAELKCRSRMHYYLADQEARRRDPHARALLLDQEGFIGEASTANVVAYSATEGVLSPRMEKVLPGVSVAVVREIAAELGVPFVERDITPAEFAAADEVWLSSTSVCQLPVVQLDGRPIGSGAAGPMYGRFLAAWNDRVGLDVAAQALRFAQR